MRGLDSKQGFRAFIGSPRGVFYVMVGLSAFRAWFGMKSLVTYQVNTTYDEWWMFRHSVLTQHFTNVEKTAMAKDMSFPLFLNVVHFSGLPYTLVLALVWIAAAWMTFALVGWMLRGSDVHGGENCVSPKVCSFLAFAYVLFLPSAFDAWAGTKLYRNAIIAPFTLVYVLSLVFFVRSATRPADQLKMRPLVGWGVTSGLLLGFSYYISENGIWLLVPTGLLLGGAAMFLIRRYLQARSGLLRPGLRWLIVRVASCVLPVAILGAWTIGYEAVNYHFFGVFAINTRTGGEPGKFVQNIYKIASPNRSRVLWAPADAIDQAFKASQTLAAEPAFYEALVTKNTWVSADLHAHPISGDFLTWSLPDALQQAGLWQSHAQVTAFFKQVNHELDQAFANGTLKKDSRIQISPAAGGLTWPEIWGLRPIVWQGVKTAVWFSGYAYAYEWADLSSVDVFPVDQRGIQGDYMTNSFLEQGPYVGHYRAERRIVDYMQEGFIRAYRVVGIPVFLVACAGLVLLVVDLARRRRMSQDDPRRFGSRDAVRLGAMVTCLASAGVVILGIAWFAAFMINPAKPSDAIGPMKYYAVASVAMIAIFDVLGVSVVWERVSNRPRRTQSADDHGDHSAPAADIIPSGAAA